MSLYSQIKPAWHPDRLETIAAGRVPAPVHVQLIISDLCNQDCSFCAYRMSAGLSSELFTEGAQLARGHNNPVRQIPTEKALEILDDCAALGVKAVQFTGGGEPTAHKDHREIFAHAQRSGLETALVTNGVKLNGTAPETHLMAWVRVSVDAGDEASYVRVRRVPAEHWGKVWRNIEALAICYGGVLGVGFVVTPDNYQGIVAAAHLAKEHGAHNLRVGAVFSSLGLRYYGDLIQPIRDRIRSAKATLDGDGFEVIDLFGRRLGDLEVGAPEHPDCGYQYLTMYIGGDLNVYRCCNTAYTRHGMVGSLKATRLRDFVGAYEPFDARGCTGCQFQGQNAAIRALTTEPKHVNFV